MSISETFEEMFRRRFGRAPTKEELTVLIDQSVQSYNQSGGITAHTVNLGPQPRHMSDVLKRQILQELPRTRPITVVAIMGDAEAHHFAQEIHAFLGANGFPLKEANGISQAMYNVTPKGLGFNPDTSEFIVGANLP